MSDKNSPLEEMKSESAQQAKDPKTRALLAALLALWLVTLAALVGVGWYAYFDQKGKSQSLGSAGRTRLRKRRLRRGLRRLTWTT